MISAMNDCVTEQFVGVLQHTHQHVIDENDKAAYDAEAAAWSASLWAETGSGLPQGFHDTGRTNSFAKVQAKGTTPVIQGTSVADGELAHGSPSFSEEGLAAMSTNELSAEVDSMLTMSNQGVQGQAARLVHVQPDGVPVDGAASRQPRQP